MHDMYSCERKKEMKHDNTSMLDICSWLLSGTYKQTHPQSPRRRILRPAPPPRLYSSHPPQPTPTPEAVQCWLDSCPCANVSFQAHAAGALAPSVPVCVNVCVCVFWVCLSVSLSLSVCVHMYIAPFLYLKILNCVVFLVAKRHIPTERACTKA